MRWSQKQIIKVSISYLIAFNKQILAIVKFILVAASSNDIYKQKEKLYQLYQKQYSEYISKLNGLSKDVKIEKWNNFNEI